MWQAIRVLWRWEMTGTNRCCSRVSRKSDGGRTRAMWYLILLGLVAHGWHWWSILCHLEHRLLWAQIRLRPTLAQLWDPVRSPLRLYWASLKCQIQRRACGCGVEVWHFRLPRWPIGLVVAVSSSIVVVLVVVAAIVIIPPIVVTFVAVASSLRWWRSLLLGVHSLRRRPMTI